MMLDDGMMWRNTVPMDDAQCEFPFFSAVAYKRNVAAEFDKCVSVSLKPQLETETPPAPTLAPALELGPEPKSEPEPECDI